MDNQQRAARLKKQIAGLETRRREIETRLKSEEAGHAVNAAARGETVQSLSCLTPRERERANREIDDFDSRLRSSERLQESLKLELVPFTTEIERLRSELEQVEAAIRLDETGKAFAAWQARIAQGFASVSELLANARVGLAEVNKLALLGEDEFGARAGALLIEKFGEFTIAEANPNQHGFRDARPIYQDVTVHLRPMTRG